MSSALFRKSVEEIFSSAILTMEGTNVLYPSSDKNTPTSPSIAKEQTKDEEEEEIIMTTITTNDNNRHCISTYFDDISSKRAQVIVSVILHFENEFERQRLIQSGAVQPPPNKEGRLRYNYNYNVNRQQLNHAWTRDSDRNKDNYDNNANDDAGVLEQDREEEQEELWDAELDMIGETQEDDFTLGNRSAIRFECLILDQDDVSKPDQVDDGMHIISTTTTAATTTTAIESVQILSTFLVDTQSDIGIGFDVEISLRCDVAPCDHDKKEDLVVPNDSNAMTHNANRVHTRMELRALLHSNMDLIPDSTPSSWNRSRIMGQDRRSSLLMTQDISLALHALDMGMDEVVPALAGVESFGSGLTREKDISTATMVHTLPIPSESAPCIDLDIASAFYVSAHEIHTTPVSCSDGTTLVCLTLEHSNAHEDDITITSISLHTSHSRRVLADAIHHSSSSCTTSNPSSSHSTLRGGEHARVDMTPNVQWGYMPGTAPSLPLVLRPGDAYSTILNIAAKEEAHLEQERQRQGGRDFVSPIVVKGIVRGGGIDVDNIMTGKRVMAGVDVRWTTTSFVEVVSGMVMDDALEVRMSVDEAVCKVGKQVMVHLKVVNLGDEVKDLKVEVMGQVGGKKVMLQEEEQKEDEGKNENVSQRNPIVVQVGEYSLGCYGLEGNDDGMVVEDGCDHALLAVNDALHLGEIKGQECIESVLRFIPLKEGTLLVPTLKFLDQIHDTWYRCDHSLKIISVTTST